jgi:hypothetical protein
VRFDAAVEHAIRSGSSSERVGENWEIFYRAKASAQKAASSSSSSSSSSSARVVDSGAATAAVVLQGKTGRADAYEGAMRAAAAPSTSAVFRRMLEVRVRALRFRQF